MGIAEWLAGLGLERYGDIFESNGIDPEVLPDITPEDLTEMGITAVGHRRKLLKAIDNLRAPRPSRPKDLRADNRSAERRQMTLLFCDIVGSTEAVSQIDPEESRDVLSAFAQSTEAAAHAQGGYVAKFMGDGALVYFGYPNALENNAEAAVRAGLAIIEATEGQVWPDGSQVKIRVGVATGKVVVGDVIGQGAAQEISVVGDTAHLAARLQALAEPGQILIDDRSRRMLGDLMVMDPLGFQALKGFDRPLTVWNVTGRKDARSRFVALRAGRMTELTGRGVSMAQLHEACADAQAGKGAIVTISGEPGIGKSRLIHEMSANAVGRGMDVMSWFCSPTETSTAFASIIGHFALSIDGLDDAARRTQLESVLVPSHSDAEEVLAIFERLLGLAASSDVLIDYSPPRLRRRTFEIVIEQLIARAQMAPLLLVVEDYHWVDPSTAELLDALVGLVPENPIVVLTTYRPEIDDPWEGRAPRISRIMLERIEDAACREMVLRICQDMTLTEDQIDNIVTKADGVPLFIEELTRAVLDQSAGDAGTDVPDTLQDALMVRIDRLQPMRKTIQTAALLGRDFDVDLLCRVLQAGKVSVMDALGAMEEANIVGHADGAQAGTYRFQHALIQDVLAEGLLRRERADIHLRIAGLLASELESGQGHRPERIANHFEQGNEPMAAMGWYITAGQRAVEGFTNAEAVLHLDKAIALSKQAPSAEAQASAELAISGLKGVALTMQMGWSAPAVGEVYRRAYDLWDVAGGGFETYPTAIGLLSYSIVRGEFEEAMQMSINALKIAEASKNDEWILAAEHEYGALLLYSGQVDEGRARLDRCIALYDHEAHRSHVNFTGKNQALFALFHKGMLDGVQGKIPEAVGQSQKAMRLAPDLHHAFSECFAALGHVAVLSTIHDAKGVLEWVDPAVEFAQREGFPHMVAQALAIKGWALCLTGQHKTGLALLHEGIGIWKATGARLRLAHYLSLLAEGYLAADDADNGLLAIEEALETVAQTGEDLQKPDILRIKADLLALQGTGLDQAEATYKAAIALSKRIGSHVYTWRAEANLGKLLVVDGRVEEGRALIEAAVAQFEQAGMPWDAEDAAALRHVA